MSPASTAPEPGGAPGLEGQGSGAGELALNHRAEDHQRGAPSPAAGGQELEVNEKLASLEKLQNKAGEILKMIHEVSDVLDTRSYLVALSHVEDKLELIEGYYELVRIQHEVESGKVGDDKYDEWKKLLKRVWSIEERASMLDHEERRQLFSAVIQRAKAVKEMIARKIGRKIEEELNTLREEVARREKEILMREGVKG